MRVVTFWPVGLSLILLPQSRGFDDGVLCLGVAEDGWFPMLVTFMWDNNLIRPREGFQESKGKGVLLHVRVRLGD